MDESRLVPFAKIGRPHGVNGEVRLWLFNYDTDILDLGVVLHGRHEGKAIELTIESVRWVDRFAVVTFEELLTREDVAELTNLELKIDRALFEDLDDDEFYQADLIGLDVYVRTDDGREKIGRVKGFIESAQDVDVMAITGKRIQGRLLAVMTHDVVEAISLEDGITVAPLESWAPEGITLKDA